MKKLPPVIDLLLVTNNYDTTNEILKRVGKDKDRTVTVICDGTDNDFERMQQFEAMYNINIFHFASIYEVSFDSVVDVEKAIITASETTSVAQNNHRALGTISYLESLFTVVTQAEVKGDIDLLSKISKGDELIHTSERYKLWAQFDPKEN